MTKRDLDLIVIALEQLANDEHAILSCAIRAEDLSVILASVRANTQDDVILTFTE